MEGRSQPLNPEVAALLSLAAAGTAQKRFDRAGYGP